MPYPESAKPVWFGRERWMDGEYLQEWRLSPITFSRNIDLDQFWNADRYEIFLGNDSSGNLFQRASRLVMTNQFYPPEVMLATSDFSLQKRQIHLGDRILQRIIVLRMFQRPVLELLTMNVITEVIEEPRRIGFTYSTTLTHSEVGEWSPTIEWRPNNDVVLVIHVLSRARPETSSFARRFTRKMQLRAHRLSIANFVSLLNNRPHPVHSAQFSADLLPASLLVTAFLLVLVTLLGVNRQSS